METTLVEHRVALVNTVHLVQQLARNVNQEDITMGQLQAVVLHVQLVFSVQQEVLQKMNVSLALTHWHNHLLALSVQQATNVLTHQEPLHPVVMENGVQLVCLHVNHAALDMSVQTKQLRSNVPLENIALMVAKTAQPVKVDSMLQVLEKTLVMNAQLDINAMIQLLHQLCAYRERIPVTVLVIAQTVPVELFLLATEKPAMTARQDTSVLIRVWVQSLVLLDTIQCLVTSLVRYVAKATTV